MSRDFIKNACATRPFHSTFIFLCAKMVKYYKFLRGINHMVQSRTHNCNELNENNVGEKVRIVGWMQNLREVSNNLAFLVLRDFYGITQVVIEDAETLTKVRSVKRESTLAVEGAVRLRSSVNPNIPTGKIEIVPEKVEILGVCTENLPFEIEKSLDVSEDMRLSYRFLDLRNPKVKNKIILRSKIVAALRKAMTDEGFIEITTPILTCSSPEGARDYLVPSRLYPGKFYALPQAPQQFKQLLMASGFDRYFQIAPCFRDEDARADRSPGEFYQLDMEMAFASQEDVFAVLEKVLPPIFSEFGKYPAVPGPFKRITYRDAMENYGSDKPDLRIKAILQDLSFINDAEFEPIKNKTLKAIVVHNFDKTRKFIDALTADFEKTTGSKMFWFKLDGGALTGGISKFISERKDEICDKLKLEQGSIVFLVAGDKNSVVKPSGVMRNMLGNAIDSLMDKNKYEFCWIVDFPMYEIGEESGELEFCHNPFSMPQGGMEALENVAPLDILAYQYDLVCNGIELSSGAVRNHSPEIMLKAFDMVGLTKDDVIAKFPALYHAFSYGAPPHAGIAPGVDRMVMLLLDEPNIREIIAFPMNKNAKDLMMNAPAEVSKKQLDDVHIAIVKEEK